MQLFLQTVVHDSEKRKNYFSNKKVLILCTLGRHSFQKVLCALVWKKEMQVSMPFSQIIPPSPSPTESKRLFFTSVSLLLSHKELTLWKKL